MTHPAPLDDEPPRPQWDDDYLDEVAGRLMFSFDLEKDRDVEGTRFDLYGLMQVESKTHIFHPLMDYGNHFSYEHLFVKRASHIDLDDIDRQIDLGHELASEWIIPDSEHYSTEFTFVSIVPEIPEAVADRVEAYKDRTLMKLGYHGHYEINLVVVNPADEEMNRSQNVDTHRAFRTWEDIENPERPGFIGRVLQSIRR